MVEDLKYSWAAAITTLSRHRPGHAGPGKAQLNTTVISSSVFGSGQGTQQAPHKYPLVDGPQEFI